MDAEKRGMRAMWLGEGDQQDCLLLQGVGVSL